MQRGRPCHLFHSCLGHRRPGRARRGLSERRRLAHLRTALVSEETWRAKWATLGPIARNCLKIGNAPL
ncbi:hypothetical protein RGUI_3245 [Rhodovulum sp. P5]|nr:hypothetical protein RGUI_3245 [Rhodovulum sp. P5]